jgi:hypothetical protein
MGSLRPVLMSLVAALAACAINAVPTTPIAGPVPVVVLVMPAHADPASPQLDVRGLESGADGALRDRGYRALPLDIGRDLLARSGVDAAQPTVDQLRRLRIDANVDAVLAVVARRWRVDGDPLAAADWDLSWSLRSTVTGAEIWRHDDAGSWRRAPVPVVDPNRSPDAFPDVQPFGSTTPTAFGDAGDLLRTLHRAAMARLPRSQR